MDVPNKNISINHVMEVKDPFLVSKEAIKSLKGDIKNELAS